MVKRSFAISLSLVVLLVMMVFSFSLVSVSAQDATATPVPVPSATPAISELGTGNIQLSFWNGLTGSDGTTLTAMLEDFIAENPDIKITQEVVAWNDFYTKLQASYVAGTPPDVVIFHMWAIPQFASFGVLKDLSAWYDNNGGWFPVDDVAEGAYNGMLYEGVPYGIPLDNHGRGLWLNVGAFENAGVDPEMDPPTTYEGWVDLFQRLTLDANGNNAQSPDFDPQNVVQWGFTVGEWPYVNFLSALAQNGGSIISEDGTTSTVNSPEAVDALQKFIDLVYTYNVSPPAAGFDTWQGFSNGSVAILPSGTWFRNFAVDQTDIEWDVWPQFQFGEQPATWFGVHTWTLPATLEGEKLEAVERLIRWVSEHQVDWAASGQVPARISAQEQLDPENYPSNILLGQTFQDYGVTEIQNPAMLEIQAAIDPELSAALNGQKTAQQALDDAAARMQQVLDRTSGM